MSNGFFSRAALCATVSSFFVLTACSSLDVTARAPVGMRVYDSNQTLLGETPLTFKINCAMNDTAGTLMSASVVLAPVALSTDVVDTKYRFEMTEKSLGDAGLNAQEIAEVLRTGKSIDVTFVNYGGYYGACNEPARFEITGQQIRDILLESGSGTYSWKSSAGLGEFVATLKRHKD